jgi:hypothetical protein
MQTTFLINKSSADEAGGDYLPSRKFKAMKSVFCEETVKLWKFAGPIAFNIICHHGRNLLALYLLAILETFTSLPFPFPFLSLAPASLLVLVKSTCWYLLAKNMHGSSYG